MGRVAPGLSRVISSLRRDASFLRQSRVPLSDRISLTAEKYLARARAAAGRYVARPFNFAGRTIHMVCATDAALLQRVLAEARETLDLFGLTGSSGVTAVDVGAHHGETALAWALWLDNPSVHSFEANPMSFQVARHNVAGTQTVVHNLGLSNASGMAALDVQRGDGGDASFMVDGPAAAHTVQVQVARGDDILQGEHVIDLIKIDVEGYELHVVEGLRETLSRTRFLTIEISLDRPKDHAFHEVAAVLAHHRFELISAGLPHVGEGGVQMAVDLHFRRDTV